MTNHITTATDSSTRTIPVVGAMRHPVKIVEHPSFRRARQRRAETLPSRASQVPVVSLNRPLPAIGDSRTPLSGNLEAA